MSSQKQYNGDLCSGVPVLYCTTAAKLSMVRWLNLTADFLTLGKPVINCNKLYRFLCGVFGGVIILAQSWAVPQLHKVGGSWISRIEGVSRIILFCELEIWVGTLFDPIFILLVCDICPERE